MKKLILKNSGENFLQDILIDDIKFNGYSGGIEVPEYTEVKHDLIEENDGLFFTAVREQIKAGNTLTAELRKADGSVKEIKFTTLLSDADKLTILAGGTLNQ